MKYEDIPRARRYVNRLEEGLADILEAIKDTRLIAADLPQLDSTLESMEVTTVDLQSKMFDLDKELETIYEGIVEEILHG